MLPKTWKPGALALVYSCALLCANASADTPLLDEVHTVAASTVAVPIEHSFTISASGTYQVSLVDLGAALTPSAPVGSVKLAITSGSTPVKLTSGGTTVTQLSAAGTAQFSATAGTYIVHVVGMPGTGTGSGPIGITVTNTADSSQVAAYSDTLALPPTSSTASTKAVLDDTFSVSAPGSYQVTLSDMQFPQNLTTLTLAIVQQGGSVVTTVTLTEPGTTASGTAALQTGVTYRIFAVGQTGSGAAGLYGVNVTSGAQSVYSKTVPVGAVTLLGSPTLTAGTASLTVADLAFPNALSQSAAAVTLNGQGVAQIATPGTQTLTAAATTYQVYGLGVASSATAPGSYAVSLKTAAGASVLDVARAVSTPGAAESTYSYDGSITTAGSYTLDVADFGYPANFASVAVAAVQGGKLLGSTTSNAGAAGTTNVTAAAGPVSVLAFATPAASATGGLFGVDLTAGGAGSAAFETSQGVGQLFAVRKVTVTTAGNYQLTVSDVAFPASFQNLAAIATRGTSTVGKIFGAGSFTFMATTGDYDINFVAQPGGSDKAGTYAMTVGTAPPAPTITGFSSSATSVSSGSTVMLTWSSQNATACTLSGGGGFSNTSEPASGSATSAALTANTTFTLTCTGAGGNTNAQPITVTIAAASKGGGGGGAIRADFIVLLLGLILLRTLGSHGVRVNHSRGWRQC